MLPEASYPRAQSRVQAGRLLGRGHAWVMPCLSSLFTGNLAHTDKLQSALLVHWSSHCKENSPFWPITLFYMLSPGQTTVFFTIYNFPVHISRVTFYCQQLFLWRLCRVLFPHRNNSIALISSDSTASTRDAVYWTLTDWFSNTLWVSLVSLELLAVTEAILCTVNFSTVLSVFFKERGLKKYVDCLCQKVWMWI